MMTIQELAHLPQAEQEEIVMHNLCYLYLTNPELLTDREGIIAVRTLKQYSRGFA